ncbi:MAG: zinc ribbon domain-containing protein [Prevotella sp.]|nr:zinc ribbon domain-containing protein [Prevotella sp.]
MALIKCSECGHIISDRASMCPHCGCPTRDEETQHPWDAVTNDTEVTNRGNGRSNKWLYAVIALWVAVIAGGGLYWWYSKTKEHEEHEEREADQKIQQFVSQFVNAVETNDIQTIRDLYPDVTDADSLFLPKMEYTITKIDEANPLSPLKVEWDTDVWMEMTPKENEGWTITSSQGLFAWPENVMEFARKTGQWKAGLTDKELSIRMKDKDFAKTIMENFCSSFKKKVMQKGSLEVLKEAEYEEDPWTLGIKIANTNDVLLSGNDYKVTMKVWNQYLYNNNLDENEAWSSASIQGKDIAPLSETVLSHTFEGTYERVKDNTVKIKWTINDQQLFNKYFVAKGDEYDKYVEGK